MPSAVAAFPGHFSAVAAEYASARPRQAWIRMPMIDNAALPARDA